MRNALSWALASVAMLLAAAPSAGQGRVDTLFDSLSEGDPRARKVIRSLCDDTKAALEQLKKAAAWEKADPSGSVDLWNKTLNAHMDLWNEKTSNARKASRGTREAELGGARSEMVKGAAKSWPPAWRSWGDAQYKFLRELARGKFIGWRHDVNKKLESMNEGLKKDPKAFGEIHEQLSWVVGEIADSRRKAERATAAADIEKELRRFTRLWTLTGNLERTAKARKEYVKGFFANSENSPDTIKKGYEEANKFFQQAQANDLLDPMCKRAAASFAGNAALALEAYEKKYEEIRRMNAPILDETLFQKLDGFQDAKFELLDAISRFESWLHDRQDALR